MSKKNPLTKYVQSFFQSYLPSERGLSAHTIHSYRDTMKLFLNFLAKKKRAKIGGLSLGDFKSEHVLSFLNTIEKQRGNSIRTRNQRLAVLKTFFSYLITQDVSRANQYEKISHITMKKQPYKPVEYLSDEEMQALLNSVDRKSRQGIRDYTILLLLYNSGARVQEICDLRLCDIRLEKPFLVTLTGKGQKSRQVPLWNGTIEAISDYLKIFPRRDPNAALFVGKRGEPLSRFGVRYIIQSQVDVAKQKCKSMKGKTIGPHTLRHTTAMHLLQSGVDLAVIKAWLGHVDLNTTHGYVEIDMKMKQNALARTNPKLHKNSIGSMLKQEKDVLKWLESL
jgi:integrase/recombinase XerD